jgi:N-acetylglucosamine-6-phosphate deacetylase
MKGAHREEYIRPACIKEVGQILKQADGLIKVWALAPEIEENMAIIKTLTASGISVSIAHSGADYYTANAAYAAGANRLTHTFNGMPPINQRYEGIITAALQHGAFMEMIADGYHISPTIAKMFIAATDPGTIVLVSDNNEFAGLPDGIYDQNDRKLIVANGQIATESGGLAGSVASLNTCALNLTHWGYSAGAALKTVTENPARSIGVFHRKGSIACGKDADIAILDGNFQAMMTIKAGRIVFRSERFPETVCGG